MLSCPQLDRLPVARRQRSVLGPRVGL